MPCRWRRAHTDDVVTTAIVPPRSIADETIQQVPACGSVAVDVLNFGENERQVLTLQHVLTSEIQSAGDGSIFIDNSIVNYVTCSL
jgi:hypothetical protein